MDYAFTLIAYLSGSIPYGLIFTKFFRGVDVREIGSGNIGATNVLRTGHKGIAAATLFCDFFKGFFPLYVASKIGIEEVPLLAMAIGAVLGHVFPIWLRFQGGKGVATSLGVFWALSLPLGFFVSLMWIAISKLAKISSLSALCAFAFAPIFSIFVLSRSMAIFSTSIALLIFWTHRSNIIRLFEGKEDKISKS